MLTKTFMYSVLAIVLLVGALLYVISQSPAKSDTATKDVIKKQCAEIIPQTILSPPVDRLDELDDIGTFVRDEIVIYFAKGVSGARKVEIATVLGGCFIGSDIGLNLYQLQVLVSDHQQLRDLIDQANTFSDVTVATHHLLYSP